MAEVLEQIEGMVASAQAELAAVTSADQLEAFRIKWLGAKGIVKSSMKLLGQVPKDLKPAVGQRLNAASSQITADFKEVEQKMTGQADAGRDFVDVTEPGRRPSLGNKHILMKVVDELTDLFGRMGFAIASGPEVEDEFHNFIALNIPESHPARDPLDNFYIAGGEGSEEEGTKRRRDEGTKEKSEALPSSLSPSVPSSLRPSVPPSLPPQPLRLLRTQTSTVQIRVMETQPPPIRVVIPGRVYRPDTHDATHLSMFHQLEALVVDKNVTMVDLKSTIMQFIHAYFGPNTRARFRPSFFPFTEPSAEVDVWFDDKGRWVELGGCGMVHPNVFKACKIDPEQYSGWAFGFGIERIAMRKYGIDDIRHFVENDIRFLSQF
ncbi:MAG TPA: phenylalanine--tRNA ligase subunit alpha [Humisphaera sp.]|jgi:phenylalanyl-tRNA synthetase alpha chain|nr:phenylalanine--tRNA ligase subunit alpha [Humisphaera sp.]